MRLNIKITLYGDKLVIPTDYHGNIMSLLKYAVDKYSHTAYVDMLETNKTKLYTWALKLPKGSKFSSSWLKLSSNYLTLHINFINDDEAIFFYKCFQNVKEGKGKQLFGMPWSLNIKKASTTTSKTEVKVKTMSSIALQVKNELGKHAYLTANDSNFCEELVTTFKYKCKPTEQVLITPISTRVVVNKLYGVSIPLTSGTFKLEGSSEAINALINMGLGSITGSGCGMIRPV